ncbi:hypothetical protein N7478_005429 [Penicillium angulare]|uniref:uncharacterized protein n=1 Tax=Penicillium angulare TaxID=116970 RepID=UPI0025410891|nr:uncharacterized protein N7478_005429 [Penicillium angulare]KAJ5280057.1 hypothetical protein N7478_005429 [Penicillium angulare]
MSPRQRKRRGPNPNSKNGCITCKFRHTKCGEEKPECLQCTTTNRKCSGYEDLLQEKLRQRVAKIYAAPVPLTSDSCLVLLPCTREERQNLHHFCTHTVHALSGFFASELWQYYLPQISQPMLRCVMPSLQLEPLTSAA